MFENLHAHFFLFKVHFFFIFFLYSCIICVYPELQESAKNDLANKADLSRYKRLKLNLHCLSTIKAVLSICVLAVLLSHITALHEEKFYCIYATSTEL